MKKNILILILITVLCLTCAFVIFAFKKNKELILQGEVDVKTVDLSSKITGRAIKINVKEGDRVQKGDVLIILDTPELDAKSAQAEAAVDMAQSKALEVNNGARIEQRLMALNALNKAKSDLDLAEKTYRRMKNLNDEGVVSNQKADEALTQLNNAKAGVKIAQSNYDMYERGARYEEKLMASANVKKAKGAQKEVGAYLSENKIIAPIPGEVVEVSIEEGELAGAGYTLVSIVDLDDPWVVFNLREDLLPKFKMDKVFTILIPALDKKIDVKTDYISAMGNYTVWRATKVRGDYDLKTFELHARPTEKQPDLRAGMSAVVDWNRL